MAGVAVFVTDITQANNKVLHAITAVLRLFRSGSSGSSTTGSTSKLYGANNGVLGVDELKTFDVDIAYCKRFAKHQGCLH